MAQAEEHRIREYLLGQLTEAEEEQVELRLLTEPDFAAEYDIVVSEITDDYIAGKFEGEELKHVEEHFFKSGERRNKLKFALALKARKSTLSAGKGLDKSWFKPFLTIAATVVLLAGGGFLVWRVWTNNSELNKGLAALQSAFRDERPLEARISKFDYAPYLTTRGPGTEKIDQDELRRAELTLLDALKESRTPAVLHALGKVYLAKKDFDKAIDDFNEALKADPKNAQVYSDLGAAWLEKGKIDSAGPESGKGLADIARSLEEVNRALELNPNLLEALFNRAIVHQYLLLPSQAEDDWRQYLKNDSASSWASEAQRNLKSLQDHKNRPSQTKERLRQDFLSAFDAHDSDRAWEVIRHSRDAFSIGKLVSDQLLDEYLQASTNGEAHNAETALQALSFVGQLEFKKTGDVYTSELSRFYRSSSPRQREILNQARELMKLGQGYFAKAKPLEAGDVFEKSKQLFAGIGDPWEAQYAELWVGYCHLNASDTQRSVTILEPLASSFERQHYKWLLMRALHLLSGAEYNLGEYSKAIDHNRRSFALAEQIADTIGAFNALNILIEQYRYIGNYAQSLDCIQRSLGIIDSCALNEVQIAQHHYIIASALASSGFYSAAADHQKESVRQALTTGQVQTISRAYGILGSIYGKMGNYSQALSNAKLAYQAAESSPDESIRKGMMAYSSLQVGDLYRQSGDIAKAIKSYDECLDLYKGSDNHYGLYEAHKNRLSCYIVQQNDPAANEELKTTLDLVEKYRSQILEGDNRNHFFDIEQSVYDLGIDFEYSRMNDSEKAFKYSEASRARSLLDLINSTARFSDSTREPDLLFGALAQPLELKDVQARIPEQAQIVQYAVLNDKLLIWVISKTTFATFETKVTQDQLAQNVLQFLRAISGGAKTQTEATQDAKELFEILIRPVERSLDPSKPVYVVPDKGLNYLPFNSLISPDSNRFLMQDYLTVVSPSSSLLVVCSDEARKKEGKTVERVLSVGNPSFDHLAFPDLLELPAAEREAQEVAGFYDSSCLLTGPGATKPQVEAEMKRSEVIHLAVHSVLDQHSPLRSKLVLAKQPGVAEKQEPGSDGLDAQEIYKTKLSRTRIVVLSSCQSGVEQYYGGEGMISLARPFLAASVPLVVVSLWPVDSDATTELMVSFHKHRERDKVSSAEALRRAQLDMAGSADERLRQPRYWAAFTAIGGWTSF